MFGTSIHWTTFFYLLIDTFIVLLIFYHHSTKKILSNHFRFLKLGLLFIAYNATGGFLPFENFPGPFILQYIITYGVAITLCIYLIYYLYKEYDIVVVRMHFSIQNLIILASTSFIVLLLIPYFFTNSLYWARIFFTIPISVVAFIFLWYFYKRISNLENPNRFFLIRNKFSVLSVSCIALLPIFTVIGDYQWLTFTTMNLAFYGVTAIKVDSHLYFLENKTKMYKIFSWNEKQNDHLIKNGIVYQNLTRREIEVSLSILSNLTYKEIAKDLFIAESTVSKHASNIFKKTGVKNKRQFLTRFRKKFKN
ncbi:helix-turn-helix domain-containing protein [Zunongwangia profunda]|uniref:helix-turn-helix domain-containing protein n=1 Tax=Zunongwangia profunda TaxID=398743 RepID=UPI001D185397|nr:helix-turn-helix transcriptional regulator [Zunongwangia profunda]MCC4227462.1 LuxR C-terminal-related transcriptional regulator [Zunongwangia profunda]